MMRIIFYGQKYELESGGVMKQFYDELTGRGMDWHDICKDLATGQEGIFIRPATYLDLPPIEAQLAIVKAQQAAATTEFNSNLATIDKWLDSIGGDHAN